LMQTHCSILSSITDKTKHQVEKISVKTKLKRECALRYFYRNIFFPPFVCKMPQENILQHSFPGYLISKGTTFSYPLQSPDLNIFSGTDITPNITCVLHSIPHDIIQTMFVN
jgi:hypothetical protein